MFIPLETLVGVVAVHGITVVIAVWNFRVKLERRITRLETGQEDIKGTISDLKRIVLNGGRS